MPTSAEHYATHIAPADVWMAGGVDAALESGTRDIESLVDLPADQKLIVDLGAGFGMHAIPLARKGYSVVAIDSSAELLATLVQHKGQLPIRVIEDDLDSRGIQFWKPSFDNINGKSKTQRSLVGLRHEQSLLH